jgi:pyruvate/2-oxoglutarate dehydrogenase complex dihydrolipoamide dehydrogenase (E3) component
MSHRYDAIIIGTGQAGPPLARRLSSAGMSVAIVERHLFGGTCVNTSCIPSAVPDKQLDDARRHGAASSARRGRQLYRPGVRAHVAAVRI